MKQTGDPICFLQSIIQVDGEGLLKRKRNHILFKLQFT